MREDDDLHMMVVVVVAAAAATVVGHKARSEANWGGAAINSREPQGSGRGDTESVDAPSERLLLSTLVIGIRGAARGAEKQTLPQRVVPWRRRRNTGEEESFL